MEILTIGGLAKATGTKVETIRWYEREGIMPAPRRTASNYRAYATGHVQRLRFVRRCRDLGFSLDKVRELLALVEHPGALPPELALRVAAKVLRLTRVRPGLFPPGDQPPAKPHTPENCP